MSARQVELERVANTAAEAAARVVSIAAVEAANVAHTAAQAAHALASTTSTKLDAIKESIDDLKARLDTKYVTVEAFDPVRNIVFGMAALMMIAVVGALIALVVKSGTHL